MPAHQTADACLDRIMSDVARLRAFLAKRETRARAAGAKPGTIAWKIGRMAFRRQGVSRRDVCKRFGWKSVSIPQVAAACRLDLYSKRVGREVRYYAKAYQRGRLH